MQVDLTEQERLAVMAMINVRWEQTKSSLKKASNY